MDKTQGFFAYSAFPLVVGEVIEAAIKQASYQCPSIDVRSWKALDVVGHFISEEVISGIERATFLVADISVLNFNVIYEIGYAIGKGKRVIVIKNKTFSEGSPSIREVGIFDTLGYQEYQNSNDLVSLLSGSGALNAIDISSPLNQRAPVYLLDTKHKTDWITRIISRIKKARYIFRTFDPAESPRLSAHDAIAQVSQSYGVVVPLLSPEYDGYIIHNLRGAFLAGLAGGMGKALCIMQAGDGPVPLDYRDFVRTTQAIDDINPIIADFAAGVAEAFQQDFGLSKERAVTFLQSLDLGASSAENEMRTLQDYYLRTDQFLKALRGEAHLVVGRKGSGKSAIFLQIRDRERNRDRGKNIVLDLKPEGYKLVKFKEMILRFLEEGTFQHTITAFWEYVLLLELCYKLLEKDKQRHLTDHVLYEPYRRIADIYNIASYYSEGDFSERMTVLMEKIQSDYNVRYGDKSNVRLSEGQVTEILYQHDVRSLERHVIDYMKHKGILWLLFDNIDKGWPTSGLQHHDVIIIRALIEATRKIERQFAKHDVHVNTVIFLRNDVYELLVRETSDRGKEASVILDWTDPDLLREIIRLRIVANDLDEGAFFLQVWHRVCLSHYKGEETSQYFIDRSLMRPRFLLNLINQCKSFAVNLGHSVIEEKDIEKGISSYSMDLLTDIGYEISDVCPEAEDVLYAFIGSNPNVKLSEAQELLHSHGVTPSVCEKIIDLLLWYGFLGIKVNNGEAKYIYDFNYNMKLLMGVVKQGGNRDTFVINPAFWPALMIEIAVEPA